MIHLTSEQLQDYLDTRLSTADATHVEAHCESCPRCATVLAELRVLHSALRRLPLEKVSPEFTERVLTRLRVSTAPSLLWNILRNLAPILSLSAILGVLFMVLHSTGQIRQSEFEPTLIMGRSILEGLRDGGGEMMTGLNEFIQSYFSFAFAEKSYGLTLFVLLFFGAIALLDRALFAPMLRRKLY